MGRGGILCVFGRVGDGHRAPSRGHCQCDGHTPRIIDGLHQRFQLTEDTASSWSSPRMLVFYGDGLLIVSFTLCRPVVRSTENSPRLVRVALAPHDSLSLDYSIVELNHMSIRFKNFTEFLLTIKEPAMPRAVSLSFEILETLVVLIRAGRCLGGDERAGDQPAQPVEAAEVPSARGAAPGPAVAGPAWEDLGADGRGPGPGRRSSSWLIATITWRGFSRETRTSLRRCGLLAAS